MSIRKFICAGLVTTGLSASAFALPEIVPHRGVWKSHKTNSNAENSVEAYIEAATSITELGDKHPDYVEVDLRIAVIDDQNTVVVFHDKFWDRLTDYTSKPTTDNWAIKAFNDEQPDSNALDNTYLTSQDFSKLTLRRVTKNGYTRGTNEKVLRLADFIDETACEYDTKLLLDIQDRAVAELAAESLKSHSCPSNSLHSISPHTDVAYFRPFVGSTIPLDVSDLSAAELPAAYVKYYGEEITYVWGLNSGQIDGENCSDVPCPIKGPGNNYDSYDFFDAAFHHPNTAALNFSYPGAFPGDAYLHPHVRIENTLDALFKRYKSRGVDLISSTTRPEGALLFETKANNGNLSSSKKKNFCMPFNYHAQEGNIRFFSDSIYDRRENWAKQDEFDYIIVDGYQNSNGKLAYDLATEIEYMCGDKRIITDFEVTQQDGVPANQKERYLNLREHKSGPYHTIYGIQGEDAIRDRYQD